MRIELATPLDDDDSARFFLTYLSERKLGFTEAPPVEEGVLRFELARD